MCGVHRIWYSNHYFIEFFSYLHIKYKVCTCPVNQLPIVWPPPFTQTQILYARNQQPLYSRAINLCSRWPHYEQPCLYSLLTGMQVSNPLWSVSYRNFFYLLVFCLGSKFACVRLMLFTLVTLWVLHVDPAFQKYLNRLLFPLSVAHRVSNLKISWTMTFCPLLKISWMDLYCDCCDGWLWTTCNWGLAIVLLDQHMYQKCLATVFTS